MACLLQTLTLSCTITPQYPPPAAPECRCICSGRWLLLGMPLAMIAAVWMPACLRELLAPRPVPPVRLICSSRGDRCWVLSAHRLMCRLNASAALQTCAVLSFHTFPKALRAQKLQGSAMLYLWEVMEYLQERGSLDRSSCVPCQDEEQDQEAALVQQIEPLALALQVVELEHLHSMLTAPQATPTWRLNIMGMQGFQTYQARKRRACPADARAHLS